MGWVGGPHDFVVAEGHGAGEGGERLGGQHGRRRERQPRRCRDADHGHRGEERGHAERGLGVLKGHFPFRGAR